jgi:hypothetical protein
VSSVNAFLARFWARQPVSATFAGVHEHDQRLPDWSPAGLEALDDELRWDGGEAGVDAELARAVSEVQRAELATAHGVRGNPALWTGEAVFGVVSLLLRDSAPDALPARLDAIPAFLSDAREVLGARPVPESWVRRAMRDCAGGDALLARVQGAEVARRALARHAEWLGAVAQSPDDAGSCSTDFHDLLLARGHFCTRPRADLLAEARDALGVERARLDEMARAEGGSWPEVQARIAADHPAPDDYLAAFARTWDACRARAEACDAVTWPDGWPLRYTTYPDWAQDAAPLLYFLHYRSPAPFEPYTTYDYLVPARPDLRVWNHAAIKLNHVVHHGAVGHHVQNWHAYRQTRSRIGQVAAVDCASRIATFQGGTMAEGWACYATALMDELGFLTPLERVSEQHSRVRFLVRAVTDLAFHERSMSFDDGVRLWTEQASVSEDVGRAEMAKCAMFPGTAVMYWLGTQGILDLRERVRRRDGAAFSLRAFHDELLGHGSIPVPLAARLMEDA